MTLQCPGAVPIADRRVPFLINHSAVFQRQSCRCLPTRSRLLVGAMIWLGSMIWLGCGVIAPWATGQEPPAADGEISPPPTIAKRVIPHREPLSSAEIRGVFERAEGDIVPPDKPDVTADWAAGPFESLADQDGVNVWVEELGSSQFAVRERAAAELHGLGNVALPALRTAASQSDDLEVRLRAADVIAGIVGGEVAGRIDEFLAGQDVALEGWDVFREVLGDSLRLRELFVELRNRHRDVAASLDQTSEQRKEAFLAAQVRIQRGLLVERRFPSQSDTIALLLLANDPGLPLSRVDEESLLSVLRKTAATSLLQDAQLSAAFTALVGGWMRRPDLENNEEALTLAMQFQLPDGLVIAERLLIADKQLETNVLAMQAMARFGSADQVTLVATYLNDERPVSRQHSFDDKIIETQLGDLAAATIVLMRGESLSEYGMRDDARQPMYGFTPDELGIPLDDPDLRQGIREKLAEKVPEIKSVSDRGR